MKEILGDNDLNNLPTKIHYTNFGKGIENCQNLDFYHSTELRLNKNEGLKKVSDKIMKALCYVYDKGKTSNFNSNICNYFYYWLSDMLLTNLKDKSLYAQFLGIIYDVLYNDKREKICKVIDYDMKVKDIKKFKVIFDYSQDYDTYMEQLTQDNHKCTDNYKDYLQKYVDSYNELKSECGRDENSYKYCGNFKTYISNKDRIHLSTWISKLEVTTEQIEQTKEGSSRDIGETQLHSAFTERSGSEGRHRSSDSSSTEIGINASPLNGTPTPTTSKSITAVASTAGFLVPSFLMYKFTPAGTWINKLLGRTPNINHMPLRDSGIIEQFPYAGHFNTENDRFNISYSPE